MDGVAEPPDRRSRGLDDENGSPALRHHGATGRTGLMGPLPSGSPRERRDGMPSTKRRLGPEHAGEKRLRRVLVSAYACEPDRSSEPGVGWNWTLQIARYNEVWVMTRQEFRLRSCTVTTVTVACCVDQITSIPDQIPILSLQL